MAKEQTWDQWARACGRDPQSPSKPHKSSLAALTGQDFRAMNAFAATLKLYACSDDDGQRAAVVAMRALLSAVQPSVLWIARELIPFVLEWHDRERFWPLIEPPETPPWKYGNRAEMPPRLALAVRRIREGSET